MLDRIRNEPAVIAGLVQAVLGLVLAFGVPVTDEQVGVAVQTVWPMLVAAWRGAV